MNIILKKITYDLEESFEYFGWNFLEEKKGEKLVLLLRKRSKRKLVESAGHQVKVSNRKV